MSVGSRTFRGGKLISFSPDTFEPGAGRKAPPADPIAAAAAALIQRGRAADLTATGLPTLAALERVLGWRPSQAQRAHAMRSLTATS